VLEHGLDASRIAAAGDSVGGNMTAALTLMARQRGDLALAGQVLFYPGHRRRLRHRLLPPVRRRLLPAPRCDAVVLGPMHHGDAQRAEITASPLRATADDLAALPPALVITAEADVLRGEGEAYVNKLRAAGVPVVAVRYQGIIHDFVTLNALCGTHAAQAAISQAIAFLHTTLGQEN
jgi:acetyl esterase